MANVRVKISYGRTCQSAPYESIKLNVAIEKDIKEGAILLEEVDKTVNGLRHYVKNKIAETLKNE